MARTRETKAWLKWVFLALFFGGASSCGAFVLARSIAPPPVPVETVQAALAQRIHSPGSALPVMDSGVVPIVDGRARADVSVPAGQCVFAAVGGALPLHFLTVGLFESDSREALVYHAHQRMVGLGWCAAGEPLELTLWATAAELPEEERTEAGEGAMVYRFHVGEPDARWQAYVAGHADEEKLAALTEARGRWLGESRDARRAPSGAPLFRADIGTSAALALPLSEATRSTARQLGTVGRPDQPYAPTLRALHGSTTGTERPAALVDDTFQRVLAVLDPSDLPVDGPVPCVRVYFSRLAGDERVASALSVPTLALARNVEHRLCPGDPLVAFVTDADDGATWRMRVLPAEGPTAPRRPTAPPTEPLVGPAHRAARADCEGGDAVACAVAAQQLAVGRFVAPDPEAARRFADRACRAEAEHCGVSGDLLEEVGDLEGAFRAWSRGCHQGDDGWSCATLGEAYRLGEGHAFDAASANDAYAKACRLGVEAACRRSDTMALLELGG